MIKIIITIAFAVACQALEPQITGKTPPPVPCPNYLCHGKADGNYQYKYYGKANHHYFVQCSNGLAYCQACWPLHLVFREDCNQCLYNFKDECVTTKPWYPATTFECPDKCPHRGPHFSGNIADPNNPHHYVACWHGATVGCIACPKGLKFNEDSNACLFGGIYNTEPNNHPKTTPTTTTTPSTKTQSQNPYDPYYYKK